MVSLGLLLLGGANATASASDSWRRGYSFPSSSQPARTAGNDFISAASAPKTQAAPGPPPAGTLKQTGASVDVSSPQAISCCV